jgi:AcrR family transcriptional regulator
MSADTPKRRGRPPSGQREAILEATLALLRERGIARLTTREVAQRAGVSDASVYYHFTDRPGLLQAVFEQGLEPLAYLAALPTEGDLQQALLGAAHALDGFFDQVFPVIFASQSDPDLREALAAYMTDENLGPHRGVQALGEFLRGEQASNRVRADIDPEAAAMFLIGSIATRALHRAMRGDEDRLPSPERVAAALAQMLEA